MAGIFVLFVMSIVLLGTVYMQSPLRDDAPKAVRGVLDLSGWSLERQGMVLLDGEWEFYPDKLLGPDDFRRGGTGPGDRRYVAVPGTWKSGSLDAYGVKRKGAGTYRLVVRLSGKEADLGLRMVSVRMAHSLFVDGVLKGQSGVPAVDPGAFKPGNTPYTTYFHTHVPQVELIVQVANYNFVTGGLVNSMEFGLAQDVSKLTYLRLGSDIGVIMLLSVFGAYQLGLYALGRRDRAYAYSGLFMLLLDVNYSLYHEKVAQRLLPHAPFELLYKLLDFGQFGSEIVFVLFLHAIEPRLMSRRLLHGGLAPFYGYLAAVLTLPYAWHSDVKYAVTLYQFAFVLLLLARMTYLFVTSRREKAERTELVLLICGLIFMAVHLVNSALYSENIVFSNFGTKLGVIGFVIMMAVVLAKRYSNSFQRSEQLAAELLRANRLKDELLLNTSHELKTPLHGIMNMAAHLLQEEPDAFKPENKRHLWMIQDTAQKLSLLVRDLIDLARLKHDDLQLEPVPVDLRTAAELALELLRFELGGKPVRLENHVEAGLWALADENRLRQVLYNVIHNAIKHTGSGFIRVTAGQAAGLAVISVEDTGSGIVQERHETIFNYLERGHERPAGRDDTGLGVGLYMSRVLVERMGGTIAVAWSEPGAGTRITFTLPLTAGVATAGESGGRQALPQRPYVDSVPLDIQRGHAQTILVVDDEASNIHVLLNLLSRQPYNVITAFSTKEALFKLKLQPKIDLVITDVMMPESSGFELCRKLRGQYSIVDLPILLATVKDAPEDVALGYQAGANDYVTKPFSGETLLARIQTLLAMKTAFRQAVSNELAFHQAQIKPHFLYNALSSVISFCYTDGEQAARLLTMLSQYLRYILETDRLTLFVPLHRELELVHAYIEIEHARFGDAFAFRCEVDEGLEDMPIPSLCIQPFVENALRHGLFEKEEQGTVTLGIYRRMKHIQVIVTDNGAGMGEERLRAALSGELVDGGIAIPNIRRRLETISGASLSMQSEPGIGTEVTLLLPIESVE
ncbi:hybrid sensor histidine kinase/response regulator [Paenibacillus athensensis]|uniref:hybrid sensor histidine kinase/response regulator n=1 Tax=Paenibacillus athensensis TaxID=1967502 RepID=UPI001E630E36|nr:ATP-binding protein [Paenibacillus athensensis]